MIEIEKEDAEYVVVDTISRREYGRSKSQRVAIEQRNQLVKARETREEKLRQNEQVRADSMGA